MYLLQPLETLYDPEETTLMTINSRTFKSLFYKSARVSNQSLHYIKSSFEKSCKILWMWQFQIVCPSEAVILTRRLETTEPSEIKLYF